MEKPVLQLKSIKLLISISEETPAYSATLYADGKKVCEVSNAGHGGPDTVSNWKAYEELNERVRQTFPKSTYGDIELEADLESECHQMVWDNEERKKFKRNMAKRIVYIDENGSVMSVGIKGSQKPNEKHFEMLRDRGDPIKVILNQLPFEEAYELFLKHARPEA